MRSLNINRIQSPKFVYNLYDYQMTYHEEFARRGSKNPRNIEAFRKLFRFRKPREVIDIGAHIGFNVLEYACVSDKVYAFEPCSTTRTILKKNLKDNKITNVIVSGVALSDRVHNAGLVTFAHDGGNYLVDSSSNKSNVERVRAHTLDSVLFGTCSKLDFIKIDVEGHELQVVMGGSTLIQLFHPVIETEMIPSNIARYKYTRDDLFRTMTKWGYKPFNNLLKPVEDINRCMGDAFWVHQDFYKS